MRSYPFVIEYGPSSEEEQEVELFANLANDKLLTTICKVDHFQERKCIDFKRMMLESVKEGGVIGLPVPLGFDDVQVQILSQTWNNRSLYFRTVKAYLSFKLLQ